MTEHPLAKFYLGLTFGTINWAVACVVGALLGMSYWLWIAYTSVVFMLPVIVGIVFAIVEQHRRVERMVHQITDALRDSAEE